MSGTKGTAPSGNRFQVSPSSDCGEKFMEIRKTVSRAAGNPKEKRLVIHKSDVQTVRDLLVDFCRSEKAA